tara:strand:- start:252 stop:497 length:246 start_codon:yes stop_codon:yes gene_type:complete
LAALLGVDAHAGGLGGLVDDIDAVFPKGYAEQYQAVLNCVHHFFNTALAFHLPYLLAHQVQGGALFFALAGLALQLLISLP